MICLTRRRLYVTVFAALAPIAGTLTPAPVHAASCLIQLRSGNQSCFTASQIARAENRIPFAVVRPTTVVAAAPHLRLSQVADIWAQAPGAPGQIAYIYGSLGRHADLVALPGHGAVPYVLVQEIGGKPVVPVGPRVTHVAARGPWTYTALLTVRGQNLSLIVTSNVSREVVHTVGSRVRSASSRATPGRSAGK